MRSRVKYKKRRSYLDGKWILTLQSHCNPFSDGKSHIELKLLNHLKSSVTSFPDILNKLL